MDWIYLSPHLDDAAFSCGGLIWEQAQAGEKVAIWTICAGDPPPGPLPAFAETLHARWDYGRDAVSRRREEDRRACSLLGATPRHFPIPDCIYRSQDGVALYDSEEDLFGELHPAEASLVEDLITMLAEMVPLEANLACPLTLGGHVDHRLVRQAAEKLDRDLWYYADYPYVLREGISPEGLDANLHPVFFPISTQGLQAWEQGIAAYASQISSFWEDTESMRASLRAYLEEQGGLRLWRRNGA